MMRSASLVLLAWVLWSKAVSVAGDSTPVWTIVDATTAEIPCKTRAVQLDRQERNNVATRYEFFCLPDTIDPRPRS